LKKLIIKGMGKRYFSDKIVKWYLENRRPLPWRDTLDPYHIWLSEVILQQTRVAQGLPYYQRFIETFPTVKHLADAEEQKVLRLWQGLGYYSRARNLHKCARVISADYGGKFPRTSRELQALPGIGSYTAAAIASFCFGEPVAVVDGNVYRILSRIFGLHQPINSTMGKTAFAELANELITPKQPAHHNQAVMEFGATFCTPLKPRCDECPFQSSCVAYNQNLISQLPVKTPAKKARRRYFFYVVLEKQGSFLMRKRAAKDIWQGLFDFLLIEKNRPVKIEKLLAEDTCKKWVNKAMDAQVSKSYKHILSHQTIHCRFIHVKVDRSFTLVEEGLSFYSRREIAELPKPVLISRFLEEREAL
jgi:A/G-specific adenine glycosylase